MGFFCLDIRQKGSNLLIRYMQDGEEKMMKYSKYEPTLYRLAYHGEESEYTELIDSKPVIPVKFKNIWEAKNAIYESSGLYYGNRNFNYTFRHEQFGSDEYEKDQIRVFYLDIECPSEQGFPEASLAEWPIDALTIYDTLTKKYVLFSLYDFDVNDSELLENNITPSDIIYNKYDDEVSLMKGVLKYWGANFPVAVTGWNSGGFDLPYIYNRLVRLGLNPNDLSPWGVTTLREREFQGREVLSVDIMGGNDLDYLELYKKSRFITRESYKLGFIGQIEGIKEKVDFSEDANNLRTLNKVNPQKYQVYNIVDVQLVKLIDDKLGYMNVTFNQAYFAGINLSDVKSPVATWENIIYRNTIEDKIILPPKKDNEHISYEGAYVKPPQVGKHKWVVSFDLDSLYSHLIMMYNISPETITDHVIGGVSVDSLLGRMEYEREYDYCVTPSGNTFNKDKLGIAPYMMDKLYKERKLIKRRGLVYEQDAIDAKEGNRIDELREKYGTDDISYIINEATKNSIMDDGEQLTRKLLLNSFYGALANIHCNMFDIRLAESITLAGQLSIRWISDRINDYLNSILNTQGIDFVIYCDTDSTYVKLEKVVEVCGMVDKSTDDIVKFLDKFCEEKMQPIISSGYGDLTKYVNAYAQKMNMSREVISDNSIFCSKKRYAMSVWNSEGVQYTEPYIKTMGLDVVKSSTPQVCRDAMKETIKLILNSDENDVQCHISKFKKEFKGFKPHEIAFPRGVNKLEESYCRPDGSFRPDVTVPINSRAAINYNNELKNKSLTDYETIRNGDKIKFIYLELPNRLQQNVMGMVDVLPEEFKLAHKIDYKTQFFKTYLKPMDAIMQLIGWEAEPTATLDAFFVEKDSKPKKSMLELTQDLNNYFGEQNE